MSTVNELLNKIWAKFRQAGITDDLQIIQSIAALLLDIEDYRDDEINHSKLKVSEIKEDLYQAITQANSPGNLLDRYVLFRLPEMLRGGRYVTPRHIVRFMLKVVQVSDTHSLADFACGSGGFLVHSGQSNQTKIGVEISPEWAKIARSNLLLNGQGNVEIITGDSLRLVKSSSQLAEQSYDRIVMNPPLGLGWIHLFYTNFLISRRVREVKRRSVFWQFRNLIKMVEPLF